MALWQLLSRIGRPIDGDTFVMNGGLVVRVAPLKPRWTLTAARWGDESARRTRLYPASWRGEPPAGAQRLKNRADAVRPAFCAPEGTWQST